ncbi:serine hydrolase FSH [Clohesyomyces aquaticus]|uniref:Serine hydrolase FSH n=1 Tax=Clohesyomyces aquaticus TaxID=1231657 RepID=A0A1Y2A6Q2_9PLEO|nr:serine hydrolase FSH [Clohesyomyces aquaticus]
MPAMKENPKMRFLCLAGAFGNVDKFAVQLAPIVNQLEEDGTAPSPGFEDFFGGPPFFRFLAESQEPDAVDGLERIRDFPSGASPEDTLRLFNPVGNTDGLVATASHALEYLQDAVREKGPFDGIIGYSEGALVGGTLIMKEAEFRKKGDYNNHIKMAMFFGGWPPLKPDLRGMMLADETDLTVPVPTIHVIGSLDPYLDGSLALFNVCDPDTAVLFDHAKGHTLPRDKDTVKELCDVIRDMIADIRAREE